ncbi:MAG: NADH-quinone oxidoreductase subunit M [Thermoguttaceae bacterium]|nr:NADH-quinone oxidoreductase subunit M [Thermoguttaceae bacterium]MDW8079611.1 NADH-quinone oxidoreductase subunit M [Thermoguttaceae bacterium]
MEVLLVVSLFLPTLGAVFIWTGAAPARQTALAVSLVVLAAALALLSAYPASVLPTQKVPGEFAVIEDLGWLGVTTPWLDIRLSVGLDGLSILFYVLTALLTLVAVLVSWEDIRHGPRAFYGHLMLLETGMLGVFAARDLILFYIFFELTLLPLFFLIGIWGSEARQYAAIKFFLFTLAGSVLTFIALLAISLWHGYHSGRLTFSIPEITAGLAARPMELTTQLVLFLGLFAGFAIKVPLVPLHTWLPLAHVEAPTAGSILLAGILLKVGSYGFVRFCLPMLPEATIACLPWLIVLSVAGIVYGSLVALAQRDLKRLIAYSSIGHLGFCMLGVFSLSRVAVAGGVLQMINHGISTGALFALVGMIYERFHTRQIADFGGLARRLPVWAFFMGLMVLASIGLPGLNGFAGEVMVLVGFFQRTWAEAHCPAGWFPLFAPLSVLAVLGVVLGAWYMLWMTERVVFGPLRLPGCGPEAGTLAHPPVGHLAGESSGTENSSHSVSDLKPREVWALAPLAVLVAWIGVHPGFFIRFLEPTIWHLTAPADRALARRLAQEGPQELFAVDQVPGWFATWHSSGSQVPAAPAEKVKPPSKPYERQMPGDFAGPPTDEDTPLASEATKAGLGGAKLVEFVPRKQSG